MQKKHIILFCLFLFSTVFAQDNFQITSTTKVGPGAIHRVYVDPFKPWNINVFEVDLTNPLIKIETAKGDDRLYGFERTSSMAQRKSSPGHTVIGAVNGDFYNTSTGEPLTTQLINGEMLKTPINWWSIAFNTENKPDIGRVSFSGTVLTESTHYTIHGVNKARETNQLILYNPFFGSSTGTNQWGEEVLIKPVTEWIVNDTVVCVVEDISGEGSRTIPAGRAVLSGHGNSETFINDNINTGDTLRLVLSLQPSLDNLVQLVGGNNKLLENGNYVGGSNTAIHPRTAAGFSQDSTILYLVTIDGRMTNISRGMSYREVADFMKSIGARHAVNLDGGGSTTMVIHGDVKNYPCDNADAWGNYGVERSVSNTLMTVSLAPVETLSSIQVEPDNVRIYRGKDQRFNVSGWDDHFNKLVLNGPEIEYAIDPELGFIDENGVFTAADSGGQGYLYITYNGLRDSAKIYIKSITGIDITPDSAVTDTIQKVRFNYRGFDDDGMERNIAPEDIHWECLNPQIGIIDTNGVFDALQEGYAAIVGRYRQRTDTSYIRVDNKKIVRIEISPEWAVTDTTRPIEYRVTAFDKEENTFDYPPADFRWESLDETIGIVDEEGRFRGRSNGEVQVVASYVYANDTVTASVQIGTGEQKIDDMNTPDTWSMSGERVNLRETSLSLDTEETTDGNGSLALDYMFIRERNRSYLYLDGSFPDVYGIPDSIQLDFKSNGENHEVYFRIRDQKEVLYEAYTGDKATISERFDTLSIGMASFSPETGGEPIAYPVRFETIKFRLGYYGSTGDTNRGRVYMDNLRVHYPSVTSILPLNNGMLPVSIELKQNYPNPFNPSTTIEFNTMQAGKVKLVIYNLVGQEVAMPVNRTLSAGIHTVTWEPQNLGSGIYLCTLQTDQHQLSRKMIYLK